MDNNNTIENSRYIYLEIPSIYVETYTALLKLLVNYGEDLIKDCNSGCKSINKKLLDCWNLFQSACAAYNLEKYKESNFFINYINEELRRNYSIELPKYYIIEFRSNARNAKIIFNNESEFNLPYTGIYKNNDEIEYTVFADGYISVSNTIIIGSDITEDSIINVPLEGIDNKVTLTVTAVPRNATIEINGQIGIGTLELQVLKNTQVTAIVSATNYDTKTEVINVGSIDKDVEIRLTRIYAITINPTPSDATVNYTVTPRSSFVSFDSNVLKVLHGANVAIMVTKEGYIGTTENYNDINSDKLYSPVLQEETEELVISPVTVSKSWRDSAINLLITTEEAWEVSCDTLSFISDHQGVGNKSIFVDAGPYSGRENRAITITVSTPNYSKTCVINQGGKPDFIIVPDVESDILEIPANLETTEIQFNTNMNELIVGNNVPDDYSVSFDDVDNIKSVIVKYNSYERSISHNELEDEVTIDMAALTRNADIGKYEEYLFNLIIEYYGPNISIEPQVCTMHVQDMGIPRFIQLIHKSNIYLTLVGYNANFEQGIENHISLTILNTNIQNLSNIVCTCENEAIAAYYDENNNSINVNYDGSGSDGAYEVKIYYHGQLLQIVSANVEMA